jgi:hypothetical protein
LLEKNIQALKLKNPSLAEKILNHQYSGIEVFQNPHGDINISYNNVLLHDENNPVAEAENLFNTKAPDDSSGSIYILYGLGLGYLLKRTAISSKGRIIVFEPSLDILRFTLEFVDFQQEILDNRIYICNTTEEVTSVIKNKYIIGDILDFIILPTYMKLNTQPLEILAKQIVSIIESKKIDQGTILKRSKNWGIKSLSNLKDIQNALPVEIFKDQFKNIPVIIASAGPSLDNELENLKNHRDKFILISVNTSLRALLKNDIIPDFCAACEVGGLKPHFEGLENLDKINYLLHPRTENFVWKLSTHRNFVYLTETDGFAQWYNKLLNNRYSLWPSAGTVSLLAFYIAAKVFRAQNIILIGQDLAFINNKVYSPSSLKDNECFEIEDNTLKITTPEKTKEQFFSNLKLVKTKNIEGEDILTREDYFEYIKQYEDIISQELPETVNIYNTSLKGAYIKGMHYTSFEELLSRIIIPEKPYYSIIDELVNKAKSQIEENKNIVDPKIALFYENIQKAKIACSKLLELIENILSLYARDKENLTLLNYVRDFYTYKTEISEFINNEEIMFFILQKAYLTYVQNYITPQGNRQLSIEDHIKNMEAEKALLENVNQILKRLSE